MSLISFPNERGEYIPAGYGGCTCDCHRHPGVMHCVPCCSPSDSMGGLTDRDLASWKESGSACAPFPGMAEPWPAEKIAEFEAVLSKWMEWEGPKTTSPELLAAADVAIETIGNMTDEELFAALEECKPSQDYIDFMEMLERGDHLNTDILPIEPYRSGPLTPVDEMGKPIKNEE